MSRLRWKRFLAIAVAVAALLMLGSQLRAHLGIDFSAEGIRAWVQGLGLLGPLVYLALFAVRQVLAIPAVLIIPSAGLCFGLVAGTTLATIGLLVNAVIVFLGARWGFRAGSQARDPRAGGLAERLESTGPWLLASFVAHPAGPLTPAFVASGMSSMSLTGFAGVTLGAGLVRCLLWAFFGSTLVDFGSPLSLLATGILAVTLLVPILYRTVRSESFQRDAAAEAHGRTAVPKRRDR